MRLSRRPVVATATAVLLLTACSGSPPPPVPAPDAPVTLAGWQTVRLPGGVVPASIAAVGDDIVVGGSIGSGAGRTPALVRARTDHRTPDWQSIPLTPSTPYGKLASLVSVAADLPDDAGRPALTALGAAHGGAHANFRWTVWTGSTAGLVDRPQTFETFGGQEAGGLLAAVQDAAGPLLVGTWQGPHGLDGALWRADGARWVRQPTPAPLLNTDSRQVAPRTATGQPDASVTVEGSVIDLDGGVHQRAAVWRGSGARWQLSVLPDPGSRSLAWSTACAATGPSCWTVGSRDDRLAVWADGGRSALPPLPVDDADGGVLIRHDDRVVVVASSHGLGRLLVSDRDGGWRSYTAPDGVVAAAALAGTRLYLVTGADDAAVLSVRDLGDVLTG